jgi:hypothetical protein
MVGIVPFIDSSGYLDMQGILTMPVNRDKCKLKSGVDQNQRTSRVLFAMPSVRISDEIIVHLPRKSQ